jgi:outer membrane receptor protein involved in Fe transport
MIFRNTVARIANVSRLSSLEQGGSQADYAGFVGSSWTYTGTRYTDFSSSVSTVESHVKLPEYNTLQAQAGLDNGHYNIELFGNNLTNARGITEYGNSGGANQTGLAAFIQPRTIGIELGVKF